MVTANTSNLSSLVNRLVDSLIDNADRFPLCCSQILYSIEVAVSNTFGLMAQTTGEAGLSRAFPDEALA